MSQFILPTQQKESPPFTYWNAMFSPPECDALIALGESKVLTPGKIGVGLTDVSQEVPTYRKVETAAILPADAPWAYERIAARVAAANAEHFRYDITGLYENLVFLKYNFDEEFPGKYNWHQDIGGGMASLRKLSTVTQLSATEDYDGCQLHLFTNEDFIPPYRNRGDTVMFPSYLPHMVEPITRGTRYSLVSWVTGPAFR